MEAVTRKPKVAVLRTRPETVLDDYARLAELAGLKQALDPAAPTILKDNISWHMMFPGANTTPWQLEGTVKALQGSGYNDLVAVENRTVVTNPYKGDKLNKFDKLYERFGIPIKYNFKPRDMTWQVYRPRAKMLVLDKIFPEGILIPDFFHGKNIVHLPTVKCHIYTTTTGAMKNAFGGLLNTKRHYTHSVIHETLVDLLHIQKEIHAGLFAMMDGTTMGNGPGPRTMEPVEGNTILASSDMVAIDAVAAKLMGFDPMSLPYIRLAHEAGLGCGKVEDIRVVGDGLDGYDHHFKVGDNLASHGGDFFWFGHGRKLQHLMFHTPLVYGFIWASFVYHDYVWYPTRGKQRVDAWKQTAWGKLFDQY
jgi:hypothetical protein